MAKNTSFELGDALPLLHRLVRAATPKHCRPNNSAMVRHLVTSGAKQLDELKKEGDADPEVDIALVITRKQGS